MGERNPVHVFQRSRLDGLVGRHAVEFGDLHREVEFRKRVERSLNMSRVRRAAEVGLHADSADGRAHFEEMTDLVFVPAQFVTLEDSVIVHVQHRVGIGAGRLRAHLAENGVAQTLVEIGAVQHFIAHIEFIDESAVMSHDITRAPHDREPEIHVRQSVGPLRHEAAPEQAVSAQGDPVRPAPAGHGIHDLVVNLVLLRFHVGPLQRVLGHGMVEVLLYLGPVGNGLRVVGPGREQVRNERGAERELVARLGDGHAGVRYRVALRIEHLDGQVAFSNRFDPLFGLADQRPVPVIEESLVLVGCKKSGIIGPRRREDRQAREEQVAVLAVRQTIVFKTDADGVRAGGDCGHEGIRGPVGRSDSRLEELLSIETDLELRPGAAAPIAARDDDEGAGLFVEESERAGRGAVLEKRARIVEDGSFRDLAEVGHGHRQWIRGGRKDRKSGQAQCKDQWSYSLHENLLVRSGQRRKGAAASAAAS